MRKNVHELCRTGGSTGLGCDPREGKAGRQGYSNSRRLRTGRRGGGTRFRLRCTDEEGAYELALPVASSVVVRIKRHWFHKALDALAE
eukprot:CAMPEP_0181232344 /NCGR_PEP_ID=MMETSP1096-20121128/35676_1 /TAXON_ID=156174 ORGANISM="Chrysochromulina ericina, Strain CCMP281" /NCGR_SAMPLE_ID=MMETSP1096 /ASSEMBLY_ACC=CAM_ASM_000453 /LENGTH=87 /DNA_ID=CAMNT_0023326619 /DNA_START=112 /DNA_END=375 /DNA_ORIENTATION=+